MTMTVIFKGKRMPKKSIVTTIINIVTATRDTMIIIKRFKRNKQYCHKAT